MSNTKTLHGRRIISVYADTITSSNVVAVLNNVYATHTANSNEIQYLYDYYKGKQPVLERTKTVRDDICNKIVENRANEIVAFKVGYLCGEPIQYVTHNSDKNKSELVNRLNELMFAEDKASQDQEIIEWQMICGTAYRLVLPDETGLVDEAPFELFTLDPRNTFIVYSSKKHLQPLMGVTVGKDEQNELVFSVYTDTEFFVIKNDKIIEHKPHSLSIIPIFEYPANSVRMGAFEVVLPILDMINNIQSNRMDGMEQFIQAFIKFINCEISEEEFQKFKELGAIKVKSIDGNKADVDVVTNDLNQDQSQTLKEDCYNSVLTICGIPNRNGGSSTSDTGTAVLLRDGWSLAEARAKDSEHMFKRAEKQMLRLVLKICRELQGLDLRLVDIDLKFTRRNYDAIQSKSQVLISMLQQPKVHPLLAFVHSGLFTDPESAYAMSMDYYEETLAKWKPVEVEENISQEVDDEEN